ncbi:MAG: histidine phosphatase family protein [Arenicellales bacterium]
MRVVLFRHGIAEDRTEFSRTGRPDSDRPLTTQGVERSRQTAAGLLSLLPDLGFVATSPYRRARQTADLIAAAADAGGLPVVVDALQPAGKPAEICRWLASCPAQAAVALVGHEPDLSELMGWFTAGECGSFARFKKAGACLIEFHSAPGRGAGELQWLLTPTILRQLAD